MADPRDRNYNSDMPRPKHIPQAPKADTPHPQAVPRQQTAHPDSGDHRNPTPARQQQATPRREQPHIPKKISDADKTIVLNRQDYGAYDLRTDSPEGQYHPHAGQQSRTAYEETERRQAPPQRRTQQGSNTHRRASQGGSRSANETPHQKPEARQSRKPKATPKKRRRRAGCLTRILLSALSFAVLVFALYSFLALKCINKLDFVDSGTRIATSKTLLSEPYVTNVLLIGSDSRDDTRGRSDSMILLSINKKTDKIFLTSLMRDMYVDIPGRDKNKINAAYSFGGPELLMDTIQENLGVKIDDYIEISFVSFASIVDAVGGVEITVSDAEAQAINQILQDEVNGILGDARNADLLSQGGKYILNGKQALCYSRIRHVGNADFQRTERQREVLTQLVTSLKNSGAAGMKRLMSSALPKIRTNMTKGELYQLSLRMPFLLNYEMTQIQIPADGTYTDDRNTNAGWALVVDLDANRELLKEQVFAAE